MNAAGTSPYRAYAPRPIERCFSIAAPMQDIQWRARVTRRRLDNSDKIEPRADRGLPRLLDRLPGGSTRFVDHSAGRSPTSPFRLCRPALRCSLAPLEQLT